MNNKKIGNLLVKCKDRETGEECYVEISLIGEAIIRTLLEDESYQEYSKNKNDYLKVKERK